MAIPVINTQDFLYDLPADRIAQHPLANRHDSKLLVAEPSSLTIHDRKFADLPEVLPRDALIVMNDSRVLPARIPVFKATGGAAEIFLLSPVEPSTNPALSLQAGSPGVWNCLIGGKKINTKDALSTVDGRIRAEVLSKDRNEATVRLEWSPPSMPLGSILEEIGKIPLPPYMRREADASDNDRYQTIYGQVAGSVAAPTAGLHFSDQVLDGLAKKLIQTQKLTLHVGAGTFKPVEAEEVAAHTMHSERFEVGIGFLRAVAEQLKARPQRPPLVAVGTTSIRTLESLYWIGAQACEGADLSSLDQWSAYSLMDSGLDRRVSAAQAFTKLAEKLELSQSDRLVATTSLMIVPGYRFQTADLLLTNFHQPQSSLILLVAAWMGPNWRKIYTHALSNHYRFLSYGDSSLLAPGATSRI
ncbi:MAG: S-adenosylmethionine:tRNA ribosyltransferase-isomerase [Bdellovibrionales bacterium]|nr:S-adenosylmethionine:tRNA ribosyltransferase-isomerase [Bdellovibrionales bacterium]